MEKLPISATKAIECMLSEWKRGMLAFWTLSLLLLRSMYGLDIKKEIENSTQGKMRLGTSTIYQLLRRLEKRGLVESRWERTSQGPPRAYYQITPVGREVLYRYITEVFAPGSPIAAAMNELMPKILQRFTDERG